jgi:hypothetical protein
VQVNVIGMYPLLRVTDGLESFACLVFGCPDSLTRTIRVPILPGTELTREVIREARRGAKEHDEKRSAGE